MAREEWIPLIKLAIAIYVSAAVSELCGFPSPLTAVFSAVFLMAYGNTIYGALAYGLLRIKAQLLGIVIGAPVFFFLARFDGIPKAQRLALGLSVSAFLILLVGRVRKLDIPDMTLYSPVLMIQFMTGGDSFYPVKRLLYCLVGIAVGVAVNIIVYPPRHRAALTRSVQEMDGALTALFVELLEHKPVSGVDSQKLEHLRRLAEQVRHYAGLMTKDYFLERDKDRCQRFARFCRGKADSCSALLELLANLPNAEGQKDQGGYACFLRALFQSHLQLLSGDREVCLAALGELPINIPFHELTLWHGLCTYRSALKTHLMRSDEYNACTGREGAVGRNFFETNGKNRTKLQQEETK